MNRVWTEEELEILRRDRAEKVPVPVTAAKLGRPVPATYARARLIGTLVQPHQPWDEASVARLRELVSADPPMTDKKIAEALGRTVTQIRWKMQDLELIGVRDLSKLARATTSERSPRSAVKFSSEEFASRSKPAARTPTSVPRAAALAGAGNPAHRTDPAQTARPAPVDPRAAFEPALKRLEATLAERLKSSISETEAGMVRAATDAIAEKRRIDQRLAEIGKRIVDAQADRTATAASMKAQAKADEAPVSSQRRTPEAAPPSREHKPALKQPKPAAAKSVMRKPAVPVAQGVSQAASPRQTQPPAPSQAPKILVVETPAAVRPEPSPNSDPVQVSGRGGWKSVRRDPARVAAQAKAKAKATSRADAVDLALAAQAAIDRFIAERGVTRTERSGIQALVSRLQARGYIVVQDGDAWVIDQRHRVEGETALIAFAEARGISDMAA